MFTVKQIFPQLKLSSEETNKARCTIGRFIYMVYRASFRLYPQRTEEDGRQVRNYPEEFRAQAKKIVLKRLKLLGLGDKIVKRNRIQHKKVRG